MRLDNLLDDEQAQAHRTQRILALAASRHRLEQRRDHRFSNGRPVIVNAQGRAFVRQVGGHGDRQARGAIGHAVGDQVAEHLLQAVLVHFEGAMPARIMANTGLGEGHPELAHALVHRLAQIDLLTRHADALP